MQKNHNDLIYQELSAIISEPDRILLAEPMHKHTTFRIGGLADFLLLPATIIEIQQVLAIAKQWALPVTILGRGSNVLVADRGIRGIVLRMTKWLGTIRRNGDRLIVGAGANLSDVARYAAGEGLTGLEFAIGIPGTIGGAVFMNAGAYGGEISQVVVGVTAVDQTGEAAHYAAGGLRFGYRSSTFAADNSLICEVELQLQPGDKALISQTMQDYTLRRNSKQPVELPSAGSAFKRPPGHYAGTLIEAAGLKGFTIGGAQVSPKHAGFIVNIGGATAADVKQLIAAIKQRVYAQFAVELQPEIRLIGEDE